MMEFDFWIPWTGLDLLDRPLARSYHDSVMALVGAECRVVGPIWASWRARVNVILAPYPRGE